MPTSHPQLRVLSGPSTGTVYAIQPGWSSVGRDPAAVISLPGPGISLRHATLTRDATGVLLTDLGSLNDTLVNGDPLYGARYLEPGDTLRLGHLDLTFELAHAPAPGAATLVRPGRAVPAAVLVALLGWLVTAWATYAAGRPLAVTAWLLTPAAATLAGLAHAAYQSLTRHRRPSSADGLRPAAAMLVVALTAGAAGFAATVGARYATGWLTGNEDQSGRQRMVTSPAPTGTAGGVTVTVTGIVDTPHFTRVELEVDNQERGAATLSLGANCVLTAGGVTLRADAFRSDWQQVVAPLEVRRGHVTFKGHLPPGAPAADLTFLTVPAAAPAPPTTLTVRSIPLRSP